MKFNLDTSAYSAFNRGDSRLREWFRSDSDIKLPMIVVGELRAGFAAGSRRKENDSLLDKFLDSPNVGTLTLTETTTKLFAEIYLSLRKIGKPIGTNDIWIAAMALEHDQPLLTLDDDFSHIPGLMLVEI